MSEQINGAALLRAACFAAEKHAGQRRKGVNQEPYINHLLEVAHLVSAVSEDPELLAAALLHDTVEDTAATESELFATFGIRVVHLVMECTDDQSLPDTERKRLQVVNAPRRSAAAGLIKLADKISNLRAIHTSPPADWSPDRKQQYASWAEEVVGALRDPNPLLLAKFRLAVATVRGDAL